MGLREILDQTFVIMRNNFWTFQGIMFKSFLPSGGIFLLGLCSIIIFLITTQGNLRIPITNQLYWSELLRSSLLSSVLLIVFLVILGIAFIVTMIIGGIYFTYSSIKIYQYGLHDKKCTLKEAFDGIKDYRLRIFLSQLILGLSALVFTIPITSIATIINLTYSQILGQTISYVLNNLFTLVFSFFFFLVPAVIVLSNYDLAKALKRSFSLPSKHRLRIFGIFLAIFLLELGLNLALFIPPFLAIFFAIALKNIYGYLLAILLVAFGILLLNAICTFTYGPMVALYYDLQIRKEGYDLQLELAALKEENSMVN